MKIVLFLLCFCYLLPVQSQDTDRYSYCESCLKVAQEIEKTIKEAPTGSRHITLEKLLSWRLCEKIFTEKNPQISKETMKSTCMHLLDSHRDQFHAALLKNKPQNVKILLCYELSHACVGVKRQAFQDSADTFTETDIDALIEKNKENVRIAQPVHAGASGQKKVEL